MMAMKAMLVVRVYSTVTRMVGMPMAMLVVMATVMRRWLVVVVVVNVAVLVRTVATVMVTKGADRRQARGVTTSAESPG